MTLIKDKNLSSVNFLADKNGILYRVQLVRSLRMIDDVTSQIDEDIGERKKVKEFGEGTPNDLANLPASVKQKIRDFLGL